MKAQQAAFTLLESLLGLVFTSVLTSVLLTTFIAFRACYQRVMTVALFQDDGGFAVSVLRRHIHAAEHVVQVIPQSQLTGTLKRELKSESDVLILKEATGNVAFYVALASWQQDGKEVHSLFEKPLESRRQELVAHVVKLHFKNEFGGISYDVTLRSSQPVLRFVHQFTDRYLYRTWYGFATVGAHVAT